MEENPHNMTPEEADKKICPMRMIDNELSFCDGPNCMAWRWDVKFNYDKETGEVIDTYSTTHGYCGMVRS